ncbi:MAG TPA: hypothetical protein VFW44_19790 [Bryobacteraceae bacterium]|nr:hypothetical protein [Bryobacteraceae bacterium]
MGPNDDLVCALIKLACPHHREYAPARLEADHRIHSVCEWREIVRILRVEFVNAKRWTMKKAPSQVLKVFGIDIGRDILLSLLAKLSRHVAHPGANLEHLSADVGHNRIRHARLNRGAAASASSTSRPVTA